MQIKEGLKGKQNQKKHHNDARLFSQMYISCQSNEGDLDTFFEHENHPLPPALAGNNEINETTKSDLMTCLEPLAGENEDQYPRPDVKIIDGADLIHTLDPKKDWRKDILWLCMHGISTIHLQATSVCESPRCYMGRI